jgi:hypothetical protein
VPRLALRRALSKPYFSPDSFQHFDDIGRRGRTRGSNANEKPGTRAKLASGTHRPIKRRNGATLPSRTSLGPAE